MTALSKQDVNASQLDLRTSKALLSLIEVQTIAAAGSAETDATLLTGSTNVVTASDGTKGVILPRGKRDTQVEVINTVSNQTLKVYPDTGGKINALTATTGAFSQPGGARAMYVCDADLHWYIAAANLTGTATSSTTAELDTLAGVTAGTVAASKTVVVNSVKSVDVLQATTALSVGGTGVPGAASVQTEVTKAVTAFTDTTAKAVFTVTIPNAAHAARIEVDCLGVLGAGGSIGAGESTMSTKYIVTLARTAGVAVVAGVSSVIGAANAKVAGGDDITSVVVTTSAITGAVGASNSFTINVAITRAGAGASNHTGLFTAKVLNQNATGVTIA